MKYIKNHIPTNTPHNRRPGNKMVAEYITIHNTGNEKSTAANERAWLTNPANTRTASYHIVVDEVQAIECLPLNENGWHAGDGCGKGNMASISIEICESGNYKLAEENAVKLVAKMLYERKWGVDRVKKHQDWSGKYCPRKIIPYWADFIKRIQVELTKLKTPVKPVIKYQTHKVLEGDTLWGLSRKYNVTVEQIKTLSGLKSDTLSIGQILKIKKV